MKFPLIVAFSVAISVSAQTAAFTDPANLRGERVRPSDGRELPVDQGASGLQQLLRKLNTRASILNIVAHPDDEDGGMLTLYARGLGARVADLSLTRGEGGQNAMTADFEDALGLLRTQELLSNDRYTGVDQFFGTEVDFGFSKTKEESFSKWDHQRVLYDAVRAIRLYRPLVITSTWVGGVTDGHGQHQVSGEIAQEAFVAAGDPKVFPELTAEGILPWQPLKVYARVPMQSITPQGLFDYATGQYTPAKFTNYVTGEVTTKEPSVDVVVHEGTPDPLLGGKSYVQFARIGLGLQKSQIGPGVRNAPGGTFDVSYHRYGSRLDAGHQKPHEDSFFDGIDTSVEGIATLTPVPFPPLQATLHGVSAKIKLATSSFDPKNPSAIAPQLSEALKAMDGVISSVQELKFNGKDNVLQELRIKRVQLNDAIVLALGLHMDASTTSSDVVTKTTVTVHIVLKTDAKQRIPYFSEELETSTGTIKRGPISDGEPAITESRPWTDDLNANPELTRSETRPYFFRENIEQPTYQLHNTALRNASATPPALVAWLNLTFDGAALRIGRVVESNTQPVQFVPPISLALMPHAQIMLRWREPGTSVDAFVQTTSQQKTSTPPIVHLVVPIGWKLLHTYTFPNEKTSFLVDAPEEPNRSSGTVTASVKLPNGTTYAEGYRSVGYPGIVATNMYTPAKQLMVPTNLILPKSYPKIGYLPGTGDSVPEALSSIGINAPTILTVADLKPDTLKQYDTVILGVRTYNAHPGLHGAPTQALLDYARNGGNVVVQYQTAEFTSADAPYPLTLGNAEKVVDETDPVQLLEPADLLLTTPNKITPADFNNWIEERGHGFLGTWDAHYTALTETHDPGQDPQRGGLITTQLGKGHWTYCAFALYRQLPEAVPGAYRLFVNLLNP
jgi:LmbE family N-acetylglucosaminyl deacetylase